MEKLSKEDGSWIREELLSGQFGDLRVDKRFAVLAKELADHPSLPLNQASSDWAAAKAAYRFFQNERVTPEKILEPHFLSTEQRLKGKKRIVVVQDSSTIDFTRHRKTKGLGALSKMDSGFEIQGLLLHSTLALSERGLPLGLLSQKIWARQPQKVKGHEHVKLPMEKKESFKWIEGLREAVRRCPEETGIVMVCDREADIYELFAEALDQGIDLVVRLQHDRLLEDEEFDSIRIMDRLGFEKIGGRIQVDIPGSGKRKPRVAELEMRWCPITLAAHPRGLKTAKARTRQDLELYVVDLREESPPAGEEAICWTLITTLAVSSKAAALEVMNYYKMRWTIEQFFKCLKTGCGVEECRLSEGKRLANYISLQSVIAWRLLWMIFLKRTEPEMSCETMLTPNEWKALWLQKHRRQIRSGEMKPNPPQRPPSVEEVVRWIAMLGGFLGRKGDGEPGLISIWRGWLRLQPAAEIYETMAG